MIVCKKNDKNLEFYEFAPKLQKVREYRESMILKLDPKKDIYTAITNSLEEKVIMEYSYLIPLNELNKGKFDGDFKYHKFKNYIPSTNELIEIMKRLINNRTLGNRVVAERTIDGKERIVKYFSLLEPDYKWKMGEIYVMDDIIEIPKEIYYLDLLLSANKVTNINFNLLKNEHLDLFELNPVGEIPFDEYEMMEKFELLKSNGIIRCSEKLFKMLDSRN